MKSSQKATQVAVNSLTDVGVLFGLGNGLNGLATSLSAGVVNFGVAAALMALRAAGECEKVGIKISLPRVIRRFAEKKGGTLIATGVCQGVATVFAAAAAGDASTMKFYTTATMLGLFAVANVTRGLAMRLDPTSQSYRVLEGVGIATNTVGLMLALGSEAPVLAQAAAVTAGSVGLYQSLCGREVRAEIQPNFLYSGSTLASQGAALCNVDSANVFNTFGTIANGFYAIGYMSLEAERTHGGVYQAIVAARHPTKRGHPALN